MTFRIPSAERRLSQTNESDVTGNLYSTRHIDLDEKGYIKLSDGVVSVYSETDDADFDTCQSMFHGGNGIFFVAGDVFSGEVGFLSALTNRSSNTNAPTPGVEEDGVFFNNTEVISDGSSVLYRSASTIWTAISGTTSPATGVPTVLENFVSQNSLLIGIGNVVQRYNTSWALAQTLTLPASYRVMSMAVNGNYAYIGTRHTGNGEAVLFVWTGINATNDGAYGVGTFEISAVRAYGSSVALVTSLGQLLRFNGGGFDQLGALPVYYSRADWADALNDYSAITNRGMVVDGDLIYLSVLSIVETINGSRLPNMHGGIWCYDPAVGLYHKYGQTGSKIIKDTDVDTADINTTTDVITVSGITVPPTGAPVFYVNAGTAIGGLVDNTWYYTIKVTDTTFKLATSLENAELGTAVNLTSTSDNNAFYFVSQTSYNDVLGDNRSSIIILNNTEYDSRTVGRIAFTANIPNTTGTKVNKLITLCSPVHSRGYFITPKMFAEQNRDTFNSITVRFKPLAYGDKIIVKYRDKERLGLPILPKNSSLSNSWGTWTSTTVFTTTASPTGGYLDLSGVEEGDEVEILSGSGAGHIAHVVSAVQSGFQWTVTLDEACPLVTANDVMLFKIENWTKIDTIDYTNEDNYKTIAVDTASGWCQFKVELRGRGVTIEDNVVENKGYTRAR